MTPEDIKKLREQIEDAKADMFCRSSASQFAYLLSAALDEVESYQYYNKVLALEIEKQDKKIVELKAENERLKKDLELAYQAGLIGTGK